VNQQVHPKVDTGRNENRGERMKKKDQGNKNYNKKPDLKRNRSKN